jgi:hypothetical protein
MTYTRNELRCLNESLCAPIPALEMVNFLLEHGANPNFWIFEWIDKKQDFQKAFRDSPLGVAINLQDGLLTCHQKLYQQTLIKILLDHGAVKP